MIGDYLLRGRKIILSVIKKRAGCFVQATGPMMREAISPVVTSPS